MRALLAQIQEHLGAAFQVADVAARRAEDSVAVLAELGRSHPEPLVPPELAHAREQITEGLAQIAATADALDRYTNLL
jgi:hypothetical protein